LPKKDLKAEEEAAVKKVSGMLSSGLVQGLKSGDVKGALESMGTQLATDAATSVLSGVMQSALSFIPGVGPLLSGLFGGLFQSGGLVKSPTLALVGEREPEFIVTQERMRALLSGGRPGYGFGPGDFGAPNVSVGSPNVNVEVSVAPGVDADIQTAYRASGVLTFAAADADKEVKTTYLYTNTSGVKVTIGPADTPSSWAGYLVIERFLETNTLGRMTIYAKDIVWTGALKLGATRAGHDALTREFRVNNDASGDLVIYFD